MPILMIQITAKSPLSLQFVQIRSDNGTNSTFKELIQKYSDVLRVNFIDGEYQ